MQFALNYIENSNNVENLRGKTKLDRVSTERLCAGPAVPLIYQFLKSEHPDLKSVLEETINFDNLTSSDIIDAGINKKDPLCVKVIEKFAEILAVEVGNMALKTMPFGGIYLVGGVTTGIMDYIEKNHRFMHEVYAKGRLTSAVRRVPVFIVKPEVELGIMGAEECCFRNLGCYGL
jgi:glucokinase